MFIIQMRRVSPLSICHIGFLFTHKINILNTSLPNNCVFNSGFYYVCHPAYDRHIGHFSEAVNPLLLKFRFPKLFPPMTHLFIPRFKVKREYEWSTTYLKLLLSLFPKNQTPILHLGDSILAKQNNCFRLAVDTLVFNVILRY